MKKSTLVLAVVFILVGFAVSVDAQCGVPIGDWGYGPTVAADGNDNLAVYGSGRVLQVARWNDPSGPAVVGSLAMPGLVNGIVVSGAWAYVATLEGGVVVVDLSLPSHPEIAARIETENTVRNVALDDGLLVAGDGVEGLILFDVSSPASPVRLATLPVEGVIYDVALNGTLAFLTERYFGFRVVDIADPSDPVSVASIEDLDHNRRLTVNEDGTTVYLTNYFEGIHVIDVTDHLAPEIVNFIDNPSYTIDVLAEGGYLFAANRGYGMRIFDLADPETPVEVAQEVSSGSTQSVAIHGNVAFLANYTGGLGLVDISVPEEPMGFAFIDGFPESKGAAIQGGVAHIPGGGTQVLLDLSQPDRPETLSVSDFYGYGRRSVVDGRYVYATGDYRGIRVIDIVDPENPEEVGFVEFDDATDVAKDGDLLYVVCYDDGIKVVDVVDPTAPMVIGVAEGFGARTLNHTGKVLYVTDHGTGVHLVDVVDPTSPVRFGMLEIDDVSHRPEIDGDLLYIADATTGIGIFDVTDPRHPVELSWIYGVRYSFGMATAADVLFAATIYDGAFVFDVSNPAAPVEIVNSPLAHEREGSVGSEGNLALVAEVDGGVEVFDLGACSAVAPDADFVWRPGNPEAGHTVQLTDTSPGSIATRRWDFDDGSASSERNPGHVWIEAGDFEVSLTVEGPYGSASVTKTVTVDPRTGPPPISDPGEHVYIIAASSHAQGLADTRWVTDVVLHNPGSEAAEAFLWFMKAGQSNLGAQAQPAAIAAGGALLIEDVVLTFFEENNASGALLIGSDQELVVTSRTYNDAASGTYGQFIAGRDLDDAVESGESVRLIQLTRTTDFRTNLGVANPSSTSIVVDVSLQDADGAVVTTQTLNVPAYGFFQKTDVFRTDVDDGVAVVSSANPDAAFFPYASVVDNRTGDPMLVEPIEPARGVVIAAAAHVGGLAGTDWRTDLEICSFNPDAVQVSVDLLESDQNNSSPDSVDVSLDENSCRRLEDVLESSFNYEGSAALYLSSPEEDLTVSSRTFNTTDSGTYGQFLPGLPPGAVIDGHREARIIQLRQSQGNSSGFRTNLGLLNRGSTPTTVDVELRAATGTSLGDLRIALQPYEHRQINRVFRQVTSGEVSNGYAVVSTSTVGGSFVAYASVVDNASGDPIYIPATLIED